MLMIRNLAVASDDRHRHKARDLLLRLVDQRNEPVVVNATLAALETSEPQDEANSELG